MILAKEKVNTGRQVELDLLRAFTVVFSMIIIHVYDYDCASGFGENFTWWLDTIFGGIFAAPVFMLCMGIGMNYTRNSGAGQLAFRGLRLLTIGQVLNFFRYELIFGLQSLMEPNYFCRPAQALNFSSDIMQLAGLSFLLMALFRKLKLADWLVFVIAMLMSVCGTLLEHVQTGCYGFDQFLGFFWGTDTESFFPLFNWFIFIAAGKWFGTFYQRIADKKAFFLITAPFGLLMFALSWYLQKHTDCTLFNSFDEYYYGFSWMRLPDALSVLIMAPAVVGLFYLISRLLPSNTVEVMSHPSKHINQYYCISWWWIMVGYLFRWANSDAALISAWLNIVGFTIITVVFYNNYFKDKVEAFCSKHKTVLTILVWVVTLSVAFYAFATCPEIPNQFNGYLMDSQSLLLKH